MYDTSLVVEILEQNFDLDADVIFGICQNNIDDLLVTLKEIRDDLK